MQQATQTQVIEESSGNGRFFDAIVIAVASGSTIKAAAESCGCSDRHAYRISGSQEFKQKLHELRQQMTQQAAGILTDAASKAARTLVDMLSDEHEAKDRLAAARLILANVEPISELAELRERLAALEAER